MAAVDRVPSPPRPRSAAAAVDAAVGVWRYPGARVGRDDGRPVRRSRREGLLDQGTVHSSQWKAENLEGARGIRVHMVDDLLHRHTLVGMPRAQVDDLLGVPPRTEYFHESEYVYWLGLERGLFAIDSEWLALKFKDDVVLEAAVVRD